MAKFVITLTVEGDYEKVKTEALGAADFIHASDEVEVISTNVEEVLE